MTARRWSATDIRGRPHTYGVVILSAAKNPALSPSQSVDRRRHRRVVVCLVRHEEAGWVGDRQGEGEGAAVAWLRLDPDAPVVMLDDLLADRQAQPGPLRLVGEDIADLLEFLE